MQSRMFPDFVVNPTYNRNVLYFTRRSDCSHYSYGFKAVEVVRHGELEFPELIAPEQWREFRLKLKSESPEIRKTILEKLVEMGILTTCKKGSFEFIHSWYLDWRGLLNKCYPDQAVRGTGLRRIEGKRVIRYYFARRDFAESYVSSIQLDSGKGEKVEVVKTR